MRKKAILLVITFLFLAVQVFAVEPQPFGLILGKTTKKEAISILEKEGGKITNSGYRVIKGDIVNPNIEGVFFEGLPLENLKVAKLWFFKGVLFKITYEFPLSMSKDEFYVLYNQLKSKYGQPSRYVEPYLSDGLAVWRFKNVEIRLVAPWVSWSMYLIYTHLPLDRKAELSDEKVFNQEMKKPKRGI